KVYLVDPSTTARPSGAFDFASRPRWQAWRPALPGFAWCRNNGFISKCPSGFKQCAPGSARLRACRGGREAKSNAPDGRAVVEGFHKAHFERSPTSYGSMRTETASTQILCSSL